MQAVFLAGGLGTRMRPLTYHVPKAMARAGGKNLLEHNIENLPDEVTELIIVVGAFAEQIMNHFGEEFAGRSVTYVKQAKPLGTAHALSLCQKHIRGKFLVLMGDDVYGAQDMQACIQNDWAWLVKKVRGKFTGGRIIYDEAGNVSEVKEGTHDEKEAYVGTNLFVLQPEYFSYTIVPIKGGKEYGLPQTVALAAKDFEIPMVEATQWQQINDLQDLKRFHRELSKRT